MPETTRELLVAALLLAGALAVAGAARLLLTRHARPSRRAGPARVSLESVGLTAGDGMLIVRYRVVRPGALDVGPDKFAVVDEETGERLSVMPLAAAGALSVAEPRPRADGYVLVANRERRVHEGSRLTVTLGGSVWQHVVVA